MRAVLGGVSQVAGASTIGWRFDSGGARIVDYTIHRSGTATASGHGHDRSALLGSIRGGIGDRPHVDYCATYQGCQAIGNPPPGVASEPAQPVGGAAPGRRDAAGASRSAAVATRASLCCRSGGTLESRVGCTCTRRSSRWPTTTSRRSRQSRARSPPGTISGDARVAFVATDSLSGVHRATIEVDGVERAVADPERLTADAACGWDCRARPTTSPIASRAPRRSRSSSNSTPRPFTDGAHRVRVRVL